MQKEKQEGSFWEKGYKGWGSLVNRGKVGGSLGKMPFSFLSPRRTEERVGRGRAPGRRPWAAVVDGRRGKRDQVALGVDPPPQFQRRGPAGRCLAAVVVAGGRRPWAAPVGAAQSGCLWGKGR